MLREFLLILAIVQIPPTLQENEAAFECHHCHHMKSSNTSFDENEIQAVEVALFKALDYTLPKELDFSDTCAAASGDTYKKCNTQCVILTTKINFTAISDIANRRYPLEIGQDKIELKWLQLVTLTLRSCAEYLSMDAMTHKSNYQLTRDKEGACLNLKTNAFGVSMVSQLCACNKELCTYGEELAPLELAVPDPHDASWYHFDRYFYSKETREAEFWDAEDKCLAVDGHLVSIHNQEEHDFIKEKFLSVQSGELYHPNSSYWIGAWRPQHPTPFNWTDGTAFGYKHWALNHPNKTGNCVTDRCMDQECEEAQWFVEFCNESNPYICKKEAIKPFTYMDCTFLKVDHGPRDEVVTNASIEKNMVVKEGHANKEKCMDDLVDFQEDYCKHFAFMAGVQLDTTAYYGPRLLHLSNWWSVLPNLENLDLSGVWRTCASGVMLGLDWEHKIFDDIPELKLLRTGSMSLNMCGWGMDGQLQIHTCSDQKCVDIAYKPTKTNRTCTHHIGPQQTTIRQHTTTSITGRSTTTSTTTRGVSGSTENSTKGDGDDEKTTPSGGAGKTGVMLGLIAICFFMSANRFYY